MYHDKKCGNCVYFEKRKTTARGWCRNRKAATVNNPVSADHYGANCENFVRDLSLKANGVDIIPLEGLPE